MIGHCICYSFHTQTANHVVVLSPCLLVINPCGILQKWIIKREWMNKDRTAAKKWKVITEIQIKPKRGMGADSLVAQWLRIRLPMQGTRVLAMVWEDPTCRGTAKPVRHNYWACALEPASHNYWSPCAWSPCSATRETTTMRSPHAATRDSPCAAMKTQCSQN